jgi:hypothetical protein
MPAIDLTSAAADLTATRSDSAPMEDALLSFDAEPEVNAAAASTAVAAGPRPSLPLVAATLGVVLIGLAFVVVQAGNGRAGGTTAAAAVSGVVDITSQPPGATITIDGAARGVTPLRLPLGAGSHVVEVISGRATTTLPLTIEAGTVVRQHVEFAERMAEADTASAPTAAGSADPAGPASALPAAAGPAIAAAAAPAAAPAVKPAAAPPVAAPAVRPAAAVAEAAITSGWARLTAPIELQISEEGRSIEPGADGRIRLSPGRHVLEVGNVGLQYHAVLRVDVMAGRTSNAAVPLPNGTLSINAQPWAQVSIDGRSVGVTPIGNLSLPIGSHEVTWRHPQLGERRQMISVTAKSPVGIGMDLSK